MADNNDFVSAEYEYEYEVIGESDDGAAVIGVKSTEPEHAAGPVASAIATVKAAKDSMIRREETKLAVVEALLRWLKSPDADARADIVSNVAEHRVRRIYRVWLKYMTAMLAVGHAVFFLLMVAAVNSRFHFGHVAFPLAAILFGFGGWPIWTQRTKWRMPIPRMHRILVVFYVGVGVYVAASLVAHLVWVFNVKAQADHFCKDRAQSFLCGPGGISGGWLRFAFVAGALLSSAAITTCGLFVMRYVFVYAVFLEWSYIRHHVDSAVPPLTMNKFIVKSGALLVRIGAKLKHLVLGICINSFAEHDSEAEHASTHPDYVAGTGAGAAEQQESAISEYDVAYATAEEEEEEESYGGWAGVGSTTNGDEIVSACLVTCCCICGCCSLVGCIALAGAAREIACLIFFVIVESA